MSEQDINTYKNILKDLGKEITNLKKTSVNIGIALEDINRSFSAINGKCNYLAEIHKTWELEDKKDNKLTETYKNFMELMEEILGKEIITAFHKDQSFWNKSVDIDFLIMDEPQENKPMNIKKIKGNPTRIYLKF